MNKQSNELGLVVVKRALEASKIRFDEVETLGCAVVARVTREGVSMQVIVKLSPKLAFGHTMSFPETQDDVTELAAYMLQSILQNDERNIRAMFMRAA